MTRFYSFQVPVFVPRHGGVFQFLLCLADMSINGRTNSAWGAGFLGVNGDSGGLGTLLCALTCSDFAEVCLDGFRVICAYVFALRRGIAFQGGKLECV